MLLEMAFVAAGPDLKSWNSGWDLGMESCWLSALASDGAGKRSFPSTTATTARGAGDNGTVEIDCRIRRARGGASWPRANPNKIRWRHCLCSAWNWIRDWILHFTNSILCPSFWNLVCESIPSNQFPHFRITFPSKLCTLHCQWFCT
jgi:hypothetical protein